EWFHPTNAPIRPIAMIVMGVIIALLGTLLWLAERMAKHQRGMNQLTLKDAIYIGLAQALAIFPGVSRSGSTITAGLALGLERETAARFSFLLSAPIILGAGIKSVFSGLKQVQGDPNAAAYSLVYLVGFVAAAVSGYLCIRVLLRYLQKNSTNVFVYYRWALAALIIIVALTRG
ncbi:MAG TPA: undecaprenyl-diphosphate phosphatase, partial [Anaerolineae bacterium]